MDREALYSTLLRAKPALASKDLIPCFTRFYFTGTHVIAYDNIKGVCLPCQTPFQGLVPGALLLGLLSTAPPGDIDVTQDDTSITMKIGGSTIKLAIEPSESFLFSFPVVTDAQRTTQLDGAMLSAIETCLISTMPEPASPQFTGVTIRHAPDAITLLSSDNVTVTRVRLTDRGASKRQQTNYILPAEFCSLLLTLANSTKDEGPQDEPQLHFGKEFVTATLRNDHRVCTRLFEDTGDVDIGAGIDGVVSSVSSPFELPKGVEGALARASVITSITGGGCRISVEGGQLIIETKESIGHVVDKFDVQSDDAEPRTYSPTLLRRVINAATHMALGPRGLLLSAEGEGRSFEHAVAQIRVDV